MTINTLWTRLLVACGGTAFPTLLRSKRYKENQSHKAELHEWENEGGNLAPAPEAPNTVLTKGSA